MKPAVGLALTAFGLLSIAALAFWARSLNAAGVFDGNPLYLYGIDSARHMRRIWLGVVHYPRLPLFDSAYAFPLGLPLLGEIGYDFLLATLVRILSGPHLDRHLAEQICAWAQPLLGTLACFGAYLVGRRIAGRASGLVAASLVAVIPALASVAQVGRVDHSTLEAPLALVCVAASWSAVFSARDRGLRALAAGALLALAMLCWSGAVVFAALLLAWGAAQRVADRLGGRPSPPVAEALAGVLLCAATLLIPVEALFLGRSALGMEFERLSLFQPLFLLSGALVLAALAFLLPREGRARRVGSGFALLAVGAVGMALAVRGLSQGMEYVVAGPVRGGTTIEGRPFSDFGIAGLTASFGPGFAVIAAAAVLLLARAVREKLARPGDTLLLAWLGTMGVLAWKQYPRYVPDLAVPLALAAASILGTPLPPRWRRLAAAVGFCLLLVVVFPLASRLRPTRYHTEALFQGPARQVLLWARSHTPSVGIETRADVSPAYGVLAPWRYGFWIAWLAERPAVGTPLLLRPAERRANALAETLLLERPDVATPQLERLRLRYVLASPLIVYAGPDWVPLREDGVYLPTRRFREALNTRLLHDDGSEAGDGLPCAGRLRLLDESDETIFPQTAGAHALPGAPVSAIKLFELVRGARLEGRAAPGTQVRVALDLRTGVRREFTYLCSAHADRDGHFSVIVPYRAPGPNGAVTALGPYRVAAGGRTSLVRVGEPDVERGADLAVR
jgi:asparagine N-glycosylation enzyme membrane subunit Stt3